MNDFSKAEVLKTQTYGDLRFRIITNELAPNQMLNEKQLMEHYGIGRAPLREVFLDLSREGLIRRFPRSGTFVAPMDLNLFKQAIEIRLNLEGLAAQLAAENITVAQLEALKQILFEVEKYRGKNSEDFINILTHFEFQFHNMLYEASHNMKLRDILRELHGISARFWHYWIFSREELFDQFKDHEKTLDALEKRNEKMAQELAIKHIHNFVGKIKSKIL